MLYSRARISESEDHACRQVWQYKKRGIGGVDHLPRSEKAAVPDVVRGQLVARPGCVNVRLATGGSKSLVRSLVVGAAIPKAAG